MEQLLDVAKKILEGQDLLLRKHEEGMRKINEMDESVRLLRQTVIGNEQFGQKGLVKEVEEIKDFISKEKIRNAKVVGGLAVIGFIWTILLKYVTGLK